MKWESDDLEELWRQKTDGGDSMWMRRLMAGMLTATVLFTMVGCAARINKINEIMASWVGHHYSDLIASWGPPQQIHDDGAGGRILVYTKTHTTVTGTATPGTTTIQKGVTAVHDWQISAAEQTYTVWRMFWANKDGIIYRWNWRGF